MEEFLTISELSVEIESLFVLKFLSPLKFSTSNFNILPFGPDPLSKLKSIFFCIASLLASGVTNNLEAFGDFDRLYFVLKFSSSETDLS